MRFALNLVARLLLVFSLLTNVAYAQNVETPVSEEVVVPSAETDKAEATTKQPSGSIVRYIVVPLISAAAFLASVVTNVPIDSAAYLAVSVVSDHAAQDDSEKPKNP